MKKFMSLALTVCLLSVFVSCKQAPDEPEVKDWTPVMELSGSELMNLVSYSATWETDWFEDSDSDTTSMMGVSWNYPESLIYSKRDNKANVLDDTKKDLAEDVLASEILVFVAMFGNITDPSQLTNLIQKSWDGNVLTVKADIGYDTDDGVNYPCSSYLLLFGEISADRKKVRFENDDGTYIYFNKVN